MRKQFNKFQNVWKDKKSYGEGFHNNLFKEDKGLDQALSGLEEADTTNEEFLIEVRDRLAQLFSDEDSAVIKQFDSPGHFALKFEENGEPIYIEFDMKTVKDLKF